MPALIDADVAIGEVSSLVAGLPVFIAGSSAAAAVAGSPSKLAYDDIDLWFSNPLGMIAGAERLLAAGFTIEPRHQRVYERWLEYGMSRKWHTHSLKLTGRGMDVNCIFKQVDGHPATSAAQVIESFDFGLLGVAFDCTLMLWRDLRGYMFPNHPQPGPLPLLPHRQKNWINGYISQYQGLREVGRYVKYLDYGWDLSLVKPDLISGYWEASKYLLDKDQADRQALGSIYETIALHMEADEIDKLRDAGKEILFLDDLDKIMEALD
jgi:hypothetical protein